MNELPDMGTQENSTDMSLSQSQKELKVVPYTHALGKNGMLFKLQGLGCEKWH